MSLRFVLGQENVPYIAEVVTRSLKADCTDFKSIISIYVLIMYVHFIHFVNNKQENFGILKG